MKLPMDTHGRPVEGWAIELLVSTPHGARVAHLNVEHPTRRGAYSVAEGIVTGDGYEVLARVASHKQNPEPGGGGLVGHR